MFREALHLCAKRSISITCARLGAIVTSILSLSATAEALGSEPAAPRFSFLPGVPEKAT